MLRPMKDEIGIRPSKVRIILFFEIIFCELIFLFI